MTDPTGARFDDYDDATGDAAPLASPPANAAPHDAAPRSAAPLSDLTPRSVRSNPRRGVWSTAIVAAIVVALIAIVWVFLNDASLFVYEADDAVSNREELGDDRFRLIGSPAADSIVNLVVDGETAVAFTVLFNHVPVDVLYVGPEPSELFKPGIPVFLEGHWVQGVPEQLDSFQIGANDGHYFLGDELRVKHDNDYTDDNEQRLSDAAERGEQ